MTEIKEIKINLFEAIGSSAAISSDDGEMVFKRIDSAIKNKVHVLVDFQNIELIVSTFLNASIGQLYGTYNSLIIRKYLKVINLNNDDLGTLKLVIKRAQEYFANKRDFETSINNSLQDD
jgi:hypothetical protein